MANTHKGEVGFEADGKTYKLRYSSNALCELEGELKCGINDIIERFKNMSMRDARAIFWAGLTENHDLSLKEAGKILDEVTLPKATDLIGKAFILAFGEGDKAGTKDARPQSGSGKNS